MKDEKALKKERYLRTIARTGTLTASCKAARVSPNTVYQWREHDETFSLAERQARDSFADSLELEATRRAWHGTKKPVYQGKELVGYIREYSDTLLIFQLKSLRPDKYRDNANINLNATIKNADAELDQEIAGLLAAVAARSEGEAEVEAPGEGESAPTD